MPQSDSSKPILRPRRAVEGALTGSLAGFVLAALTSNGRGSDGTQPIPALRALDGAARSAVAPIPLAEALDKAANDLGLTLVSMRRTGAQTATALVEARDGYHTLQCEAHPVGSREAIDDELYSELVTRMKSLACQT